MTNAILLATVLAAAVSLQGTPVTFTTIAVGNSSQIETERHVEARTPAQWAKLWRQHAGDSKAPAVDFGKEMVIGVFAGSQPSAGFGVTIQRMEMRDGRLTITYRLRRPKADEMVAQMLTSPFHLVRVPVHPKVTFVRQD